MTLTRRKKLALFLLLFYWPTIFILTHISIPKLVYKAQVSDKTIHFLAYLILIFLLWFTISPYKKVNWHKATVWWMLFVMVWYGVADEWLQACVGRNPAVMDFLADLAGVVTGLILFTFFAFWPTFLIVTAIAIFLLTNLAKSNIANLMPVTNVTFHLFAYAFFVLLWIRIMSKYINLNLHKSKWLIAASSLPLALLSVVKLFSVVLGKDVNLSDIIISATSIIATVAVTFLVRLFRRRFI